MQTVAYLYHDSLTEPIHPRQIWGWEVDQVYADQIWPDHPEARPQLQQLLATNPHRPATYVLLRRLDELGDTLEAVGQVLAKLETTGTIVLTIDQPYITPGAVLGEGEPLAWLPLADEIQAHQRSRRLRLGHAKNRLNILPPPGKAPYGYRRGQERYLIDRTTAPIVKAFVEQFLLFGSLRGAVRFLAKKYAKRIAVATGRRWLTHPVYRGDLAYRDGRVIPDAHAPLISRDEAAQIDRLLRRNSQLPPRTAGASRSLAGLVTCGTCGSAMTVSQVRQRGQSKTYLYLRPTACTVSPKCRGLDYTQVLQTVVERICQDLPQAVATLQSRFVSPTGAGPPDLSQGYAAQIAAREVALAQLPALVDTGILDQYTANLRTYTLRSELAAIQQQLAQLPPVNLRELSQSVSIPQFWFDLSEAERRFFFREFIREIQIYRQGDDWQIKLVLIFESRES